MLNKLKKIISIINLLLLMAPWQWFLYSNPSPALAASNTTTSRVDFDLGYYNGIESKSKEGEIKLNPAGSWGPRAWRTPNLSLSDQAAIASDGNYVYVLASSDNYFARYLPTENRWQALASAPHYAYQGANLVVLGNYIYAIFGGYQKEFARYSIIDNTWTEMTVTPDLIYGGSSLATDGTYIYELRGTATSDFWRYDPSDNSWTVITSTPATMYLGAGLAYYNGNLYAARGYNTTTMYRYNISANAWYTTATGGAALTTVPAALYDDHTITIRNDEIFVTRENATSFYKYNITSNSWTTLTVTPQTTRYVGVVYNSSDDYIYVFRGNGTYDFWKYNPATGAFLGPADLPNTPGYGADLVYYNGYIYHPRGNNSQNFYRYNISSNSMETLTNTPATLNDDTKGTVASGLLYFFRGGSTQSFYSYDPVAGAWSTSLSDTPVTISYGGTLVATGSGNFIYATRGSLTRTFMRYSISGNSWDDAAVTDLPDNAEAGYGARLISDGADIYYIPGNGMTKILKYSISGNNWTVLNDLPFSPYPGTDITYYNGKIYAQAGYYKTDFWEYTITGNTWRKLSDMEAALAYDVGPYNGGSLEVDSSSGTIYSISGQGLIWMQAYTPSGNNYVASGTWTSSTIDLSYVAGWTSLTSSVSTPGDSSIGLETRTSSDQISWSSWQTVTGGTISSSAARYIQIRATLNAASDYSQTPVLYSLTINYTGDENPPDNPATFTGKSQAVGGITLTSGGNYSYPHPYFTWSGAADSGTGVDGYYVYFGTSAEGDPEISGSYQTTSTYTVTAEMTHSQTYYLRLETKDTAGNVSSATTEFTYTYVGVSPPQTISQTSSSDFSSGTAASVTITNDEIKLSSKSGFWQQERLSLTPASIYAGGKFAYVSSTNKLYTFRGYNTTTFYEYNVATDVWTTKGVAPAAVYWGGGVVEGPSGYLYGWQGNNTSSFWRYDIANNTWDDASAADTPQQLSYGASMIYDGDHYIYVMKGNSDDTFMRYDTSSDTWDTLTNVDFGSPAVQVNNLVYEGSDMAYDGDNTIYATQGNTRSGFAAYDISSNSWTQLTNLPALAYNGAQIEYDGTTNAIYYLSGWDKPIFFKYNISTQNWSVLTDAPVGIGWGGAMKNISGNLYILRGTATQNFYKYNISKSSWLIPTVGLFGGWFRGGEYRTYNYGADIVKGDGDNFYLTRGNYDNLFVRYNSVTGEAIKMADAPAGFYVGAELVYDSVNNKIYATASLYYQKFFVYDIATDIWSEVTTDPPPTDAGQGSALAFDGSRYIYWIRGGTTQTFYRYDPQAAAGSKWSALTNTPATMQYGADLVIKNDYLYATRGNNQLGFYRYGPLSGSPSWSDPAVADLPTGATIYNDGFLVDGGGDYLYACRGQNTVSCYNYSISGNNWTAIANAPAQISTGGSAASNGTDKIFVIAGPGTNTFSNGLYTYVMQTSTSSFQESGSYTSPVHDLTATYKYANIDINYTSASNAALTVKTRASSDNSTWSDWAAASETKQVGTTYNYNINSSANRYLQVKLELTSSDGVYSGTISDYTINYYQDIASPTNPTQLNAYSTATKSAGLTTDNWYNFSAPDFDWPDADATSGATDGAGGSGVAGYYVYFGTDANANASTSGTLTTGSEYTAGSLVTGNTYYLKIQTVDEAGNFSTSWQPFIYKFDNEIPSNPTTITADPPGYTNTNSFTFTWNDGTDSASLVKEYCYKTGASGSIDTCTTQASASGSLAYQTGTNTFYLRTKDNAGNYSSTYTTAAYYYSSVAPGAVPNLRVTYPAGSSSNTINEFSFAWDPPELYYGQQSGLQYYYSVNALPTANNVVGPISLTYVTRDAYATQKGLNRFYVVAKDEAGNIDYDVYSVVEFTADTSAPGVAQNIDISDVSIKETSSWRIALSWDQPVSTGSGVANYKVYRYNTSNSSQVSGLSCSTNFSDFSYVASTSQTSYVDTGLTQTRKYYCVKACDSTNECSAVSDTVNFYPDGRWRVAPTLVASVLASIKTKSAIITWSTNRTSNSFVKYGKSSGSYGDEVGSSTQVTSHSISLTGLDPGTTYYYKAYWTDEDGNSGYSDELTLTTNPAPVISAVKVTDISLYNAYVAFTIKNAVKATIQYGKTINYGSSTSISISKNESTSTVKIDNLSDGTLYHLQIFAEDDEGNKFNSDDYTFETLPIPKIDKLKFQQVVGLPAAAFRLVWTTNSPVSTIVTYYPTHTPQASKDYINLVLKTSHEVILKDLKDNEEYTLTVKGKDKAGNETTPITQQVKTAADLRPPEIINMNVESTIVGIDDEAKAQIIASWDTDEPSTTQFEYNQGTGTSYGQATTEDSSLTTNHTATITGLKPGQIYHLRAVSKDKADNIGYSYDTVLVTPKATKDALSIVIDNLSTTFGFLKKVVK